MRSEYDAYQLAEYFESIMKSSESIEGPVLTDVRFFREHITFGGKPAVRLYVTIPYEEEKNAKNS